ncbi:MAG: tRNA (adenosine(37)-N6)-threonylcarbamoyltransferase complex ATPase subunit type 1 TsaE [Myxococcales bacterium]|jgi:tRNA threonylcarbamoyladenosine biosynthesis protein TsaE|nr:tRNA (adenosine(37)-N6)-threonylcarbamoyltransferase complex ATPase subunit type 1 TsaE [Myxococcales bacterium]
MTSTSSPTPTTTDRLTIATADDMFALGQRIGAELLPGDFIGLTGDLGAGKSVLVRGICAGCGIDPCEVMSPTFVIVVSHRGRLAIHHADFYRLGDMDELYATGFDDLVNDGRAAILVEWIDRIPEALPPEYLRVHIDGCGEAPREVFVERVGPRFEGRLALQNPQ